MDGILLIKGAWISAFAGTTVKPSILMALREGWAAHG